MKVRYLKVMMSLWSHCLLCVILLIGSVAAADIPFVFSETSAGITNYALAELEQKTSSSLNLVEVPPMSTPKDDEILIFPFIRGGNTLRDQAEKSYRSQEDRKNAEFVCCTCGMWTLEQNSIIL